MGLFVRKCGSTQEPMGYLIEMRRIPDYSSVDSLDLDICSTTSPTYSENFSLYGCPKSEIIFEGVALNELREVRGKKSCISSRPRTRWNGIGRDTCPIPRSPESLNLYNILGGIRLPHPSVAPSFFFKVDESPPVSN